MMYWILTAFFIFLLLSGLRIVDHKERAVVLRRGRATSRVVGPGIVLIFPILDTLRRVSIEPFSLSLPIQSAITRDEVPIQLQASLDAEVRDPLSIFSGVRDWRIQLVSQLQNLMKDRLEELNFDNLDSVFPSWTRLIRKEMEQYADQFGVEITGLSISNLSPRTRPE
jgi:regulator of protease activity HflC (stomatin/prohibitin superfamily)